MVSIKMLTSLQAEQPSTTSSTSTSQNARQEKVEFGSESCISKITEDRLPRQLSQEKATLLSLPAPHKVSLDRPHTFCYFFANLETLNSVWFFDSASATGPYIIWPWHHLVFDLMLQALGCSEMSEWCLVLFNSLFVHFFISTEKTLPVYILILTSN